MTAQFKRRQLLKLLGAGTFAAAGAGQALAGRAWWQGLEGFGTYDNTIVGPSGARCQVEIEHPQIRMSCNYSEAMIALLTSEQKYEDARNGVLRGSTDSEESKLMSEECTGR